MILDLASSTQWGWSEILNFLSTVSDEKMFNEWEIKFIDGAKKQYEMNKALTEKQKYKITNMLYRVWGE